MISYLKILGFGLFVMALFYWYLSLVGVQNPLNKSVADTSVVLIGLSMLMSSVGYFWKKLDWLMMYRKYLGLIGFAFSVTHLFLSWGYFTRLFSLVTWQEGKMWPILTGLTALFIFTIMASISNKRATLLLGGKTWKQILRVGYLALTLVLIHITLLKFARWVTWYKGGLSESPGLSLLIAIFLVVVLLMRLLLWISLRRDKVFGIRSLY